MTHWAIPTIAVVNVWRHMGYTALLVFAGLQTIPTTSTRRRRSMAAPSGVVLADHAAAAAARSWRWCW